MLAVYQIDMFTNTSSLLTIQVNKSDTTIQNVLKNGTGLKNTVVFEEVE